MAVAAVIAVIGSMVSLTGALGGPGSPSSEAEVDLAADDLAILPPTPVVPSAADQESESDTAERAAEDEGGEEEDGGDEEGESGEEDAPETAQTRTSRRAADLPSEIIDPKNWYLTLPTGDDGSPDTVSASELESYESEYFTVNESGDGVVFTAHAGGATTKNSKYPRSELREMNGGEKAKWDGRTGTHTMELDQAITKTPSTKPDVIAGQIHDGDDDVMQIHLSGRKLTVKYADGKKEVVLDNSYRLGERFRVKIESSNGVVKVWHNGELKADLPLQASNSYFKAGVYVNSNPDKGAKSSDLGQVVIYGLDISHS